MKCSVCGFELNDGAQFCGSCGSKVEAVVFEAAPAGSTQANNTAAAPNQASVFNNATVNNTYVAMPQQAAQENCLGAAWKDITSSPGWIKRLLLLAIMNCVPILNLYVMGYSAKWGADVAAGKRESLPSGNFCKHTFIVGIFILVLNFLMGFANIWLFAVNMIPIAGFVFSFVVQLFANAFCTLAVMRMTVRRKFGAAFDLSEIFNRYQKRVGSLLASAVVPGIITTVIFILVTVLILLIIGGIAYATASSSSYSSLLYTLNTFSYNPTAAIFAIITTLGIIIVVLVALYLFLTAFANVWSMRAVGHWVAQNAPEWADDEAEKIIERM